MDATLAMFVETLENRFPTIGARARKAADLVEAGRVTLLGTDRLRPYPIYRVDGRYNTSIEGKMCTCPDAQYGAPRHAGGPLCKHRLAAMMARRRSEAKKGRLAAIFEEANQVGAAGVRLYVTVFFTYDRHSEQGNTLEGYLLETETPRRVIFQPLERAEMDGSLPQIGFTLGELESALAGAGWRFERKSSTNRSAHHAAETWWCAPLEQGREKLESHIATRVGAVAA